MNGLNWNEHQEAANDTTAWAQRNLDTQPSNSPFWDSEDGQETTQIARELGLVAKTTEQERRDISRVAYRAGIEPSQAWQALIASDWDTFEAIDNIARN